MQILGKRSKVLLIAVAITMLVAIGVSFAMWDLNAVKATSGNSSTYANAKVGDIIEFGQYYQTGNKINNIEYEKTPIRWIVVDKDERTGQLTLMSKFILACGSYFGNQYDAGDNKSYQFNYNTTKNADGSIASYSTAEVGGNPYNQAYVDSTVRAYLNNLERLDLGGDGFTSGVGYVPSKHDSTAASGLLSSVGFSNQRYWTGLKYTTPDDKALVDAGNKGFIKRYDSDTEIYYQRPINNPEYTNRPATKGFYDEAFTDEEKSMIVPKVIAGYTGHRWPDGPNHDVSTKSYVEGAVDKVWLPSATELNVMNGYPWYYNSSVSATHEFDEWTNPSDEAGSTVFEYFKNLEGEELKKALVAKRTELAKDGMKGNFSIPVYDKGTTTVKTAISSSANTSDHYWTRSPSSYWFYHARVVNGSGLFNAWGTSHSNVGVRPCVILKY